VTADMVRVIEPIVPALRRYARALLRDPTEADDLVQDCLERAVASWHQRREDGDPRAWIFTILHNLAMTRLRRTAQRPAHVALDDAGDASLALAPPQQHRLHHRDLLSALSQLPEEQRAVLLLVTVEELSYADTARILDVPIGTVMSRLSRARERLFRLMSGEPRPETARPLLRRVK
jgi:RNA polymerase sigma-70 factor (ECF subfamily)